MYGKILFAACFLLFATQDAWSQTIGPTIKSYCPWYTLGGTGDGVKCAESWTYDNIRYNNECIKEDWHRYWCSTTEGTYRKKWGNCNTNAECEDFCKDKTEGGPASGQKCVFPFMHWGVTYNSCTTRWNKGRLWCATSAKYSQNSWANCLYNRSECGPPDCTDRTYGGVGAHGTACNFPFKYRGKEYNNCTTLNWDTGNGRKWCSIDPTYNGRWGVCLNKDCPPLCRKTIKGNAGKRPCIFPFTYLGTTYTKCTTYKWGNTFWCSTTPTYVGSYGECVFANNCPD